MQNHRSVYPARYLWPICWMYLCTRSRMIINTCLGRFCVFTTHATYFWNHCILYLTFGITPLQDSLYMMNQREIDTKLAEDEELDRCCRLTDGRGNAAHTGGPSHIAWHCRCLSYSCRLRLGHLVLHLVVTLTQIKYLKCLPACTLKLLATKSIMSCTMLSDTVIFLLNLCR